MTKELIDFSQEFDQSDIQIGGESTPWVQLVNPPNMPVSRIEPNDWGIFINDEQAAKVNFQPSENWKRVDFADKHWDTTTGYLAHDVRMCIVSRSPLEVQKREVDLTGKKGRWQFEDIAFNYGIKTEAYELAKSSVKPVGCEYRVVTRHLVIFLDKDGKPLHDDVLGFTMRGVFGSSFGANLRNFREEASEAYFAAAGKPKSKLSDMALSRFIFGFTTAIAAPMREESAPGVCLNGRVALGIDKHTETAEYNRKVMLYASTLDALYITRASDLGRRLEMLQEIHQDFPLPTRGENKEEAPAPVATEYDLDEIAF